MSASILDTVKGSLGLPSDYTHFDNDIIMHINSVFMQLYQLGCVSTIHAISDDTATWESEFGTVEAFNTLCQSYTCRKVRMLFDPPTGSVKTAYDESIKEDEWRFTVMRDMYDDGTL